MVTIITGPKTYMDTLIKYIEDRVRMWKTVSGISISSSDPYEKLQVPDAIIGELEELKRKIKSGEFNEDKEDI